MHFLPQTLLLNSEHIFSDIFIVKRVSVAHSPSHAILVISKFISNECAQRKNYCHRLDTVVNALNITYYLLGERSATAYPLARLFWARYPQTVKIGRFLKNFKYLDFSEKGIYRFKNYFEVSEESTD